MNNIGVLLKYFKGKYISGSRKRILCLHRRGVFSFAQTSYDFAERGVCVLLIPRGNMPMPT